MVFDVMPYEPEFKGLLGNIPETVSITVYGDSGQGKTELVMRMVKSFCLHKIYVDWVSYEQGHGLDMQMALMRNKMIEVGAYFQVSDPHSRPKRKKDEPEEKPKTPLQELDEKIKARGSSDVFVIDSIQYLDITIDQYKWLRQRHKNKAFIFISHKDGKLPAGGTAKFIAYDGGCTIMAKNYIAYPIKNRFGGNDDYFIWEERARLIETKYFEKYDKQQEIIKKLREIQGEEGGVIA